MKIAFVTQDGQSTIAFCREFAKVLGGRPDVEMLTISSVDDFADELRSLGTRHVDMTTGRYVSPLRDLSYLLRLRKTLARERVDVVISFGTKPNAFGALAARLAGVPVRVVAVRGLGRVFTGEPGLRGRILRRFLGALYREALASATHVWFTNPYDRGYFEGLGWLDPKKSFQTRNSVNLDVFDASLVPPGRLRELRAQIGLAPDARVVVMVARLLWAKGVKEFTEAAAAVASHRPGVKFLLIAPREGGGAEVVPEDFLRRAEAGGAFQWLGFRKDVRELYALADVAVLPSYYKEGGHPRALLEPMALGKPVIAADTPECRGPVDDGGNGFVVPARDPLALAARIEELLDDEGLRASMGRRSREIIEERYDDRMVVEQVFTALGISHLLSPA